MKIEEIFTNQFFESVLKKHLKQCATVRNVTTSNVIETVNNYCGSLIRFNITYCVDETDKEDRVALIAKIFPDEEKTVDVLNQFCCFDAELTVYKEVLPAISKLDYRQKVAPKAITILLDPKPILVIEDLKPFGYVMHKDSIFLNLEHCLLVVEQMAYFHAASVAAHEKNPGIYDKLQRTMYSDNVYISKMLKACSAELNLLCQRTPGLSKYADKVLNKDIPQKLFSSIKLSEKLNVLNHGDARTNNFMFYYGPKGNLVDTMMIDFQFSTYCSPVLDLQYLLVIGADLQVKAEGRGAVLAHYHSKLVKNLVKLKVKVAPPSMEQLKQDFFSFAFYGYASSFVSLPLFLGENRPDATLYNFATDKGDDCFRSNCFKNEEYVEHLKILLPLFESWGVFD